MFDKVATLKGNARNFTLDIESQNLERTPLQYFNFANYTLIPRHKYVAYYQVIEFFYIRAMKEAQLSGAKELDIVHYIIKKSMEKDSFQYWLNQLTERFKYFTEVNSLSFNYTNR